jgi:ABC-type thiamin/hydroxymethylpyrimidine transport system permease subunit
MVLETLLVLLVSGAVVASVLSLFVVRTVNPTPTIHSGTTSRFCSDDGFLF